MPVSNQNGVAPEDSHRVEPRLVSVSDVAALLRCSARQIYRLVESEKMPPPLKLGGMVRWDRVAIEQWICDGCPACPTVKRPSRKEVRGG